MRFTPARMRSSLYTAQASRYPKIPGSLLYLGILLGLPNMRGLCRTADGADTIFQGIAGCEAEKTTSVVFISGRMLQFLQTISSLHMDGTFKKRPRKPKCRQIYNFTTKYGYNVRALLVTTFKCVLILCICTATHCCLIAGCVRPACLDAQQKRCVLSCPLSICPWPCSQHSTG